MRLDELYSHHKNFTGTELLEIYKNAREVISKIPLDSNGIAPLVEESTVKGTIMSAGKDNPVLDFMLLMKPFLTSSSSFGGELKCNIYSFKTSKIIYGSPAVYCNIKILLESMDIILPHLEAYMKDNERPNSGIIVRYFEATYELMGLGYAPILTWKPNAYTGEYCSMIDFVYRIKRDPQFVCGYLLNIHGGDFRKIAFRTVMFHIPYNISQESLKLESTMYKIMYEVLSVLYRYDRLKYCTMCYEGSALVTLPNESSYRVEYEGYNCDDYSYVYDEYGFYTAVLSVLGTMENIAMDGCYRTINSTYINTLNDGYMTFYTTSPVIGKNGTMYRVYAVDGDMFDTMIDSSLEVKCEYAGLTKEFRIFEDGLKMFKVSAKGFKFDITIVVERLASFGNENKFMCSIVPSNSSVGVFGYDKCIFEVKDDKLITSPIDMYNIFNTVNEKSTK